MHSYCKICPARLISSSGGSSKLKIIVYLIIAFVLKKVRLCATPSFMTKILKMSTCYKLYLVTDSSPAILGGRDLVQVVRAAIEGGFFSTPKALIHLTRFNNVQV